MPEIVGSLIPPRQSAAPASPVPGQLYLDTDDNTLYWWDGTQWVSARGGAASTFASPVFLGRGATAVGAASAAATVWMGATDGAALIPGAQLTVPPGGTFRWDPADYPSAPAGLTMKWRVVNYAYSNSTSPGACGMSLGWRRFSVSGASGGISFSVIASDTEARALGMPLISGGAANVTQDLSVPLAGHYAAYATWTAATAANSYSMWFTKLYLVYV